MRSRSWMIGFAIFVTAPLAIIAMWVIKVDPFFHYHKPLTTEYYYPLWNQRSQNDGILKNFDYEGLITGTSMTENFKTSEAERIFGGTFIKVPYSGATYKELNDDIEVALTHNNRVKTVIRGLDMSYLIRDKDAVRDDLGKYPTYLYNRNPFDDVEYLFNRDVLRAVCDMVLYRDEEDPGIDSFDEYSNWSDRQEYGAHILYPDGITVTDRSAVQEPLTEEEEKTVLENIRQNVTELAEKFPDVTFLYFFPPYSAVWWQGQINAGTFDKQIRAEEIAAEEILKTDNIQLYSFNDLTDITTDLDNYKDELHYGEWVNSLILEYMKDGKGLLTKENYREKLEKEKEFYGTFDYEECFGRQY